jgi:hypothetical protein
VPALNLSLDSVSKGAGVSGDRIPMEAKCSAHVHNDLVAHPGSYTVGSRTSLVAWWSEPLTNSHEVPGSIPGSAVGIAMGIAGEDPHSDHCLGSLTALGFRRFH